MFIEKVRSSAAWIADSILLSFGLALSHPLQRKPFQQIIKLQLRRLPPVEDRLDDLRREQRQPQELG